MDLELKDKIVLVTGSTRGIGLAIARAFLDEGSRIVLTSRKPADLKALKKKLAGSHPGGDIFAFPCDFTKEADIQALRRSIITQCGGLDVLVANVGNGRSLPDPIPPKRHFQELLDQNFISAVDTARIFYPVLKRSRGAILFIASIAGIEVTGAPVGYAAAKTALLSFAKNLARQTARAGLRVNCLAPGNVYFPGGRWEELSRENPRRVRRMLADQVPMGRFGDPQEIANAALFLSSPRASFITGAVLTVDGGQTATLF